MNDRINNEPSLLAFKNKIKKLVREKVQALGWNHCLLGGVSSGIP